MNPYRSVRCRAATATARLRKEAVCYRYGATREPRLSNVTSDDFHHTRGVSQPRTCRRSPPAITTIPLDSMILILDPVPRFLQSHSLHSEHIRQHYTHGPAVAFALFYSWVRLSCNASC
jgi:hypothetical protein